MGPTGWESKQTEQEVATAIRVLIKVVSLSTEAASASTFYIWTALKKDTGVAETA